MSHVVIALLLVLGAPQDNKAQEDKAREEEAKKKDEEAKKLVADFQKEIARAKPDDRPAVIEKLGDTKHARILEELVKWLAKGTKECMLVAAKEVGRYKKEQKAAEALLKAARGHRDVDLVVAMLDQVGNVRYRGVAKDLNNVFRHEKIDIARGAVDAAGSLGSKESIPPLIELLAELEGIREDERPSPDPKAPPPGPQPPTPPGPGPERRDDDKLKRKKELTPAVVSALRDITGEKHQTAKQWRDWWSKKGKAFTELED